MPWRTEAAEAFVRVVSSYTDVDRRWDLVLTERDTMLFSTVLQTVTFFSESISLHFFNQIPWNLVFGPPNDHQKTTHSRISEQVDHFSKKPCKKRSRKNILFLYQGLLVPGQDPGFRALSCPPLVALVALVALVTLVTGWCRGPTREGESTEPELEYPAAPSIAGFR